MMEDDQCEDLLREHIDDLQKRLLTFQQDATEELLQQDGLSVFAQGLGMCTVAAALLAVHHYTCQAGTSGGAVILIGSSPAQRQHIPYELKRLAPSAEPISDVTSSMPATERVRLYSTAPNLFITTRILAVDLLTARLQHHQIAGMIVLNAHRASDDSGEGFAVRLLRAKTKTAFVRGLSDDAGQLSVGLSGMEHSMRALLVSRVFFWPRFQETVQQNLGHVDVCEVTCDLSRSMAAIQEALMKVLDSMLKQVQRTHKLDSSELSLAHALTKSFDAAIRRQLDAIWNTVPKSTQALVSDIRTVQSLLTYLLRFNCVSFLRYLQCLRVAAGARTEWMLHSAAGTVFQEAKARVYKMTAAAPAKATGGAPPAATAKVVAVLEEQPKWVLLRQVAEEIQQQRALIKSLAATSPGAQAPQRTPTSVQEERQAQEQGVRGSRKRPRAETPPEGSTAHPHTPAQNVQRLATQRPGSSGAAAAGPSAGACRQPEGNEGEVVDLCNDDSPQKGTKAAPDHAVVMEPNASGEEDDEPDDAWIRQLSAEKLQQCRGAPVLVVAREKHLVDELRSLLKERSGVGYLRQLFKAYQEERAQASGRRRTAASLANDAAVAAAVGAKGRRGGRTGGRDGGRVGGRQGGSGRGLSRKERDKFKLQMLMNSTEEDKAIASAAAPASLHNKSDTTPAPASGAAAADAATTGSLLDGVHFVAIEESAEHVLHEVQPVFVVLYDVDLAWVRLLEVYKAQYPTRPLKAYMLGYEDSVELAKFELSTSREKAAFMGLIRKKAHMVLPVDEAGNYTIVPKTHAELARGQAAIGGLVRSGNTLTRRAGGHELIAGGGPGGGGGKPRVIVDVREFMSSLPAVLYQRGMDVVPVTLEVGDFVLTEDVCVERKAVPDLISSLDSGRLYTQAVAMCRNYKTPILLIEFNPKKAFALQSVADMGTDIRGNNVMSKLVILLLNFPKLRVMWARSLHATADMFLALKGRLPQPDAEAAVQVGLDPNVHQGGGIANTVARDMLLDMPGVNKANVFKVMDAAGSLSGLAQLQLSDLQEAIGTRNGRMLHEFLHASYPAS